jgi:hypothetical protein
MEKAVFDAEKTIKKKKQEINIVTLDGNVCLNYNSIMHLLCLLSFLKV